MGKVGYILSVVLVLVPCFASARGVVSRAARATNTPTSGYTYNYMYPYLNNQMRSTLNPGDANAQSTSPINVVVKTTPLPNNNSNTRRVVARSGRIATSGNMTGNTSANIARAAMPTATATTGSYGANRNVVARRSTARAGTTSGFRGTSSTVSSNSQFVSSSRCLADYTECMNSYCERADTEYNRCFCSSKLAQIESKYQPRIDSLITQILRAQNTGNWTDAEMAEYWNDMIGQYVGENTWEKLDDALNIDWTDSDTKMQGQDAYVTGHQYCVNHLKNCAYAAPNMRDVYQSEISRDCKSYEKSLNKLQTALETALETYNNNN